MYLDLEGGNKSKSNDDTLVKLQLRLTLGSVAYVILALCTLPKEVHINHNMSISSSHIVYIT